MTIGRKLVSVGVVVTLTGSVLFVGAGWMLSGKFSGTAKDEVQSFIDADQQHITSGLAALVKSQDDLIRQKVEAQSKVLRHLITQQGSVSFEGSETWDAVNQFTKKSTRITLPRMLVGGTWLGHNTTFDHPTLIVDKSIELTGGAPTVWQRMNPEGDLLRVASCVKNKQGKRAIGTFSPAVMPDGKPNKLNQAILAKKPYAASSFVVDSWYQGIWQPLLDRKGEVIGMYSTSMKQESAPSLREGIQSQKIGKHGYAMVLGGSGDKEGQVLISPDGKLDGQKIGDQKDAKGTAYIANIIKAAKELKEGEIGTLSYLEVNGSSKDRVYARFAYYKPWDWVIVVKAYQKDFTGFAHHLDDGRASMALTLGYLGFAVAGIAGFVFMMFARRTSDPINKLVDASSAIAEGDLSAEIHQEGNDEIAKLAHTFSEMQAYLQNIAQLANRVSEGDLTVDFKPKSKRDAFGAAFAGMVDHLRDLVGGVAAKSAQSAASVHELSEAAQSAASSANEISNSAGEVASITNEAAAASDSIAKGSTHLAATATGAAEEMQGLSSSIRTVQDGSRLQQETVGQARKIAEEGGKAVQDAMDSMDRIQRQVATSVASVEELGHKQAQIGSIVDTIDAIAQQTNMLALNAAIEAARAGDLGRGFAVVADEVRSLAERSAHATREITVLIESVRQGVLEATESMKASAHEVEEGSTHSAAVKTALAEIIDSVTKVSDLAHSNDKSVEAMAESAMRMSGLVESVAATSEETAAGAEEVGASNQEVSNAIRQTSLAIGSQAETIRQINEMAAALQRQEDDLQDMVRQFKVDSHVDRQAPAQKKAA